VLREVLAEGPVLVEQRHADRRVGVEHLLGGDDLDLVRVPGQAELRPRHGLAGVVDAPDGVEVPVVAGEEGFSGNGLLRCGACHAVSRLSASADVQLSLSPMRERVAREADRERGAPSPERALPSPDPR